MSIDRRTLLKGTAAAGAALPLGALATGPAQAAPAYEIAVLDVNRNNVCVFDRNGAFTDDRIKWSFNPGWGDVLETRFRDTTNDGSVFLLAGGSPGKGKGHAEIRRRADEKLLWKATFDNYPHCVERVRGPGAVIVAGTRTDPGKEGGSLHLFAPTNGSISSLKYLRSYPFHQAHGVLWDPLFGLLWAVGGTALRSYRVEGTYQDIRLVQAGEWKIAGNGHDVQPDYTDTNVLYVTDSGHVYRVDKRNPAAMEVSSTRKYVKSFSRHRSGEGVWTSAPQDASNPFGTSWVHFRWPSAATQRPGGRLYKARLVETAYQ